MTTIMYVDCGNVYQQFLSLVHSTVYDYIEVYLSRQSAHKRIAEIRELVFLNTRIVLKNDFGMHIQIEFESVLIKFGD